MTYVTGNTSNTSNPAKDFMELVLHPGLVTGGFAYVEEVLQSGTNRIYKSPAAANGVGDWYLITSRSADTSTTVNYGICEVYDSGTHTAFKWAPGVPAGGMTLPADRSHYTTTGTTDLRSVAAPANQEMRSSLATAAHGYIASFNVKRIVVSTRIVSTDSMTYLGLYDPLSVGLLNHFPLMGGRAASSGAVCNTWYTREMGTGVSVGYSAGNGSFVRSTSMDGYDTVGTLLSTDPYIGKPLISRIYNPASQSKAGNRGVMIGVYRGLSAFAWGDVANIDWSGTAMTATCIYSGGTNNILVDQAM
jgi:hypothetical protein